MTLTGKTRKNQAKISQMGGRAASIKMTDEQKSARGRLGAIAAAKSMTAEQRSERARKAARARFPKTKTPQA